MFNVKALIEKSKKDIADSNEIKQENEMFLSDDGVQKKNLNKSMNTLQKEKGKTKEEGMQMGN